MLRPLTKTLFLLLQLFITKGHSRSVGQPKNHGLTTRTAQTSSGDYWYTQVQIGNQLFNLTVDTGSSDLWVIASDATYESAPLNHGTFTDYSCKGPTSPCQNGETSFNISYGSDAFGASGYIINDTVTVAGATVPDMGVEVATVVGWPASLSEDGILGLSWVNSNHGSPLQETFIQKLLPQLTTPVFTMDFDASGISGEVTLEFGAINSTKVAGGLATAYVNATNPTWAAESVTFILGDETSPLIWEGTTVTQNMNFDTGAGPKMTVDPRLTTAYYGLVLGAKPTNSDNTTYKFPCGATLPDLHLQLHDGIATMEGRAMSYNVPIPGDETYCDGPLTSDGIPEGGQGGVGTVFFQSHYVVFDMDATAPKIQVAAWNNTFGYPSYYSSFVFEPSSSE